MPRRVADKRRAENKSPAGTGWVTPIQCSPCACVYLLVYVSVTGGTPAARKDVVNRAPQIMHCSGCRWMRPSESKHQTHKCQDTEAGVWPENPRKACREHMWTSYTHADTVLYCICTWCCYTRAAVHRTHTHTHTNFQAQAILVW